MPACPWQAGLGASAAEQPPARRSAAVCYTQRAHRAELALAAKRKAYVHLVRGEISVNGARLLSGDAALLEAENLIRLTDGKNAEVLVFDLQA